MAPGPLACLTAVSSRRLVVCGAGIKPGPAPASGLEGVIELSGGFCTCDNPDYMGACMKHRQQPRPHTGADKGE